MKNYYQVLGLPNYAPLTDVKRAYKRMAMRYHPDRNPDNPQAEERFKEANEAYQVLSLPEAKAKYDLLLENGYQFRWSEPHRSRSPERKYTQKKRPAQNPRRAVQREPEIKNYVATFIACMIVAVIYLFITTGVDLTSRYHYLRALSAYEKGDFEAALEHAQSSFASDRKYARAYFLYGKIKLYKDKQPENASKMLAKALEYTDWPHAEYHQAFAEANLAIGKADLAKRHFRRTLEIGEYALEQLRQLTPVFLEDLRDYTGVFELTDKWLAQRKQDEQAYFLRTCAAAHQQDSLAMWDNLKATLQYATQPETYVLRLAERQLNTDNQVQTALQLYDFFLRQYRASPEVLMAKGKLLFQNQQFQPAIESYSQAIELRKAQPEAYYQRALAYLDLGESDSACQDWNTAQLYGFRGENKTLRFFCESDE